MLQTCLALFFSADYLAQRCKGRNKTLEADNVAGLRIHLPVKAGVLPVKVFWLHKIQTRVDIGCIKCKITISFLKGCFKFEASSLKRFVSLSQSLRRGSVLYLHDVQLIFFMFLLLPQTSFFSTYTFSGPTLPAQQVIQTHLS